MALVLVLVLVLRHSNENRLEGKRQFNDDYLANEFLLSSVDTAFQNALVKQCASVLVVGAVPFATFAQTFNRRFGYDGH